MRFRYHRSYFKCRWAERKIHRSDNWLILGIHQRWVSTDAYLFTIGFFGFDWIIWFKENDSK